MTCKLSSVSKPASKVDWKHSENQEARYFTIVEAKTKVLKGYQQRYVWDHVQGTWKWDTSMTAPRIRRDWVCDELERIDALRYEVEAQWKRDEEDKKPPKKSERKQRKRRPTQSPSLSSLIKNNNAAEHFRGNKATTVAQDTLRYLLSPPSNKRQALELVGYAGRPPKRAKTLQHPRKTGARSHKKAAASTAQETPRFQAPASGRKRREIPDQADTAARSRKKAKTFHSSQKDPEASHKMDDVPATRRSQRLLAAKPSWKRKDTLEQTDAAERPRKKIKITENLLKNEAPLAPQNGQQVPALSASRKRKLGIETLGNSMRPSKLRIAELAYEDESPKNAKLKEADESMKADEPAKADEPTKTDESTKADQSTKLGESSEADESTNVEESKEIDESEEVGESEEAGESESDESNKTGKSTLGNIERASANVAPISGSEQSEANGQGVCETQIVNSSDGGASEGLQALATDFQEVDNVASDNSPSAEPQNGSQTAPITNFQEVDNVASDNSPSAEPQNGSQTAPIANFQKVDNVAKDNSPSAETQSSSQTAVATDFQEVGNVAKDNSPLISPQNSSRTVPETPRTVNSSSPFSSFATNSSMPADIDLTPTKSAPLPRSISISSTSSKNNGNPSPIHATIYSVGRLSFPVTLESGEYVLIQSLPAAEAAVWTAFFQSHTLDEDMLERIRVLYQQPRSVAFTRKLIRECEMLAGSR